MSIENPTAKTSSLPARERLKEFWVDVFVMNTFSYAVAAPLELIVADMSWQAHLKVRLMGLLINSLIGRPYGVWREYVVQRTGMNEASSALKRYWVDSLVFLSFQLPVYVTIMALGGADLAGILKAAGTASLLAGFLGRPYGIYLDFVRSLFGLKPMTASSTPA
ncbi:L-alanine exporter AlaE [Permianibacter sp. IMCC34836]|uniref:L-alanine exporter AlaE n=1 Tax=Permianibacter fluminis TaxID=2738515 RepID=UPI00155177EC|nr:L-alanine exporter AlaE [Permianibacter fluminis]NQD38097.1 L-alanine exporter AlaE [Permianibacter fluminis]